MREARRREDLTMNLLEASLCPNRDFEDSLWAIRKHRHVEMEAWGLMVWQELRGFESTLSTCIKGC